MVLLKSCTVLNFDQFQGDLHSTMVLLKWRVSDVLDEKDPSTFHYGSIKMR